MNDCLPSACNSGRPNKSAGYQANYYFAQTLLLRNGLCKSVRQSYCVGNRAADIDLFAEGVNWKIPGTNNKVVTSRHYFCR